MNNEIETKKKLEDKLNHLNYLGVRTGVLCLIIMMATIYVILIPFQSPFQKFMVVGCGCLLAYLVVVHHHHTKQKIEAQ